MSGREAGREVDPQTLEVVPGAERQAIEGWVPDLISQEELKSALEHAFSYRGDVTITRKDGSSVEGYVFDRRMGRSLAESSVRLLSKSDGRKISVSFADVARLAFSGRDMAAGKTWESWVKQYWERRAAGEKNISLQPQEID
jgi:hypothetical protein